MYQIPTWRYWLVAVVLVAGLLLALPNVFGTDPAIQLARDDRARMEATEQERVQGYLNAQQITPRASYIEEGRLVLRFASTDEQLKARDAIDDAAPGQYVIALTDVPRTPGLLRQMGFKPMSLGLDLRGGVHFMAGIAAFVDDEIGGVVLREGWRGEYDAEEQQPVHSATARLAAGAP